jgi:hypothetical protein
MGLDVNGIKMLLTARSMGVNFERTVTIGRQTLYLSESQMEKDLHQFGHREVDIKKLYSATNGFAEEFLGLLGATTADSLDASDFEKATVIQDMNFPLAEQYKSRYTCVIESGTLEHVFNFPVAVKNCMELLEENGWYIGLTPANNFLGHGFYQFSPELYFRIFSESNGFRVKTMLFYIDDEKTEFYTIKDPNEVRQRVEMVNCYPSYLFILAQKIATRDIFEKFPLQSDYENIMWNNERPEQFVYVPAGAKGIGRLAKLFMPSTIRLKLRRLVNHFNLMDNPIGKSSAEFFQKKKW